MTHSPADPCSFRRTVSRLALGTLAMMLFSALAVNLPALLFGSAYSDNTTLVLLANDIGAYALGLPIALLLCRSLPGRPFPLRKKHALSLPLFLGITFFLFGTTYLVNLAVTGLLALMGLPTEAAVDVLLPTISPLASLLFVAVGPAILEEAVFRGLVYKKMAPYGELPYALVSAFLFASFHGNLTQFFFAFLIGFCFALLVWRTGTVIYGMLLHFCFNFLSACFIVPLVEDPIANALVGLWVTATVALAIAFFVLRRSWLRPAPGSNLPPHPLAAALLNPGMILWLVFFCLMVALSLIPM